MVTVACVLRSGGDFDATWVRALEAGVRAHLPPLYRLPEPIRFVCLSDVEVPCEHIPLLHDWPGWWAKVALFEPGLFEGPVLYLDLDTLVVGDLSDVVSYRGPFAMIAGFFESRRGRKVGQSGVMAWTPGEHTEAIYRAYLARPRSRPHGRSRYRGDADFIRAHVKHEYLQDLFPGQIVSLKKHCRPPRAKGPPPGARVVCGHGRPRLSDPAAGWAHKHWRQLCV